MPKRMPDTFFDANGCSRSSKISSFALLYFPVWSADVTGVHHRRASASFGTPWPDIILEQFVFGVQPPVGSSVTRPADSDCALLAKHAFRHTFPWYQCHAGVPCCGWEHVYNTQTQYCLMPNSSTSSDPLASHWPAVSDNIMGSCSAETLGVVDHDLYGLPSLTVQYATVQPSVQRSTWRRGASTWTFDVTWRCAVDDGR